MNRLLMWFSISGCVLLSACLISPWGSIAATPSPDAAGPCKAVNRTGEPNGPGTAQEVQAVAALKSSVESGPLYVIPASAGVAACTVSVDEGAIMLEYRFKDGGWLNVKRDARIEYMEQVAQFHFPRDSDPVAVLAEAEQAAFGSDGCSIDWRTPDTQEVPDDSGGTQTLYYGDVCNCRAGVRQNTSGHVVEFTLRSAC